MATEVRIFKKTAPNGKITAYLGKRDFVDNTKGTEPVDGVVLVDQGYLHGRKVFASVVVTYRYGREENEVMGLKFCKEMTLTSRQIYPPTGDSFKPSDLQERLVQKLGANAYPFEVRLPELAPPSVVLQDDIASKPLGVIYELRIFVGDKADEEMHRRNSVCLAVRKVQFMPVEGAGRAPVTRASKEFTISHGKFDVELSLDKEIYYHGEEITAVVNLTNNSSVTADALECGVCQHVDVTFLNNSFTKSVAMVKSMDGCPIPSGKSLTKTFKMSPNLNSNKNVGGVALDGQLKDADSNLASSGLLSRGQAPEDALGILVSYTVRLTVDFGSLHRDLVVDVPLKIVHPATQAVESKGDYQVEDFSRLRRGLSVDEE